MSHYYKNYTNKDIKNAVKTSYSLAEVLRKLNLKACGGNYLTIKLKIQRLNLCTKHFSGQGWNKGKVLKDIGKYVKSTARKEALIKLRKLRICEMCKRIKWRGKPIPLEIHHKDKDRSNNTFENLKLLCRNCHFVLHNKK